MKEKVLFMAILMLNIKSKHLRMDTFINVVLPNMPEDADPAAFYSSGKRYPVLWLLHGGTEDCTIWTRKTNIETYACERDLIVVMPSVYNSYYGSWPKYAGGLYADKYFMEELRPLIFGWLPASDRREDNFIAGNSMGGQGAINLVSRFPHCFGGLALLSGDARDYTLAYAAQSANPEGFHGHSDYVDANGGPEAFKTSPYHTRGVLSALKDAGKIGELPPIFLEAGGGDKNVPAYQDNAAFLRGLGLNVELKLLGNYRHEWRCWDIAIQHALAFFATLNPALSIK